MDQLVLQQIKNELVSGCKKKGHPFKYFTLGTLSKGDSTLRMVVLRKTYPDFRFVFYTDARSKKVKQIVDNDSVSALFYHPRKLLQLRVQGIAKIITDTKILNKIWHEIPEYSKKDYTSYHAPGTQIEHPEELEYSDKNHHFCMIEIIPHRMEYLRLKRTKHVRIEFRRENTKWVGKFLIP